MFDIAKITLFAMSFSKGDFLMSDYIVVKITIMSNVYCVEATL